MSAVRNDRLRIVHVVLVCAILLGATGIAAASASADGPICEYGTHQGGDAQYLICKPPGWNGDLVVFAHGYVAPENPVEVPRDQLVLEDGTSITETITGLGYGFAATSYVTNGLAVAWAIDDLVDVVHVFTESYEIEPDYTYLAGASEGGLITALAIEQRPDVFDGGLATCGPVGNFRRQANYWGDVRVLFDYFFPDVLPKFTPEEPLIPREVIDNWYSCADEEWNPDSTYLCVDSSGETPYGERVREALLADAHSTQQLLKVADVPTKVGDFEANVEALVQLLWYNVFAADDAVEKLGGQPFDNRRTWYRGSDHDWRLNRRVERFTADPAALAKIEEVYQTSGDLTNPIVTLHTLQDPVVPYWHEPLYRWKVWRNRDYRLHTNIPSLRYGHCAFGAGEVLFAFGLLTYQVSGEGLLNVRDVLTPSQFDHYERLKESPDPEAVPGELSPELEAPEMPIPKLEAPATGE